MAKGYNYDVAYIDSDVIVYHAAFGGQKTLYDLYQYSDPEFKETHNSAKDVKERLEELCDFLGHDREDFHYEPRIFIREEEDAIQCCENLIKKIDSDVQAKRYVHYLTGDGNYRENVATFKKYKGDRPPKPHYHPLIKRYMIENHNARIVHGVEGDDCIAVGMSSQIRKGKRAIACTIDKDLLNVPGEHYNWKTREFHSVNQFEADLFLYQQILAGDPTDNYGGIPRVGAAKALKILSGCETASDMYKASLEAYRAYYGDSHSYKAWDGTDMVKTAEEILAEHAHLAYIMRRKDQPWSIPNEGE